MKIHESSRRRSAIPADLEDANAAIPADLEDANAAVPADREEPDMAASAGTGTAESSIQEAVEAEEARAEAVRPGVSAVEKFLFGDLI